MSLSLSLSAGIPGVIPWSGPIRLTVLSLTNVSRFQLDAIPTVGVSYPILSYLSALRFIFDGVGMLKEGYQKVICLSLCALPRINPMTLLP